MDNVINHGLVLSRQNGKTVTSYCQYIDYLEGKYPDIADELEEIKKMYLKQVCWEVER